MNITRITTSEVEQLLDLSWKTFHDAFHHMNSPHNMKAYMDSAFTHDKLLSELDNRDSEFYFAMNSDGPIGYLKINKSAAQSDIGDKHSLEIERIYVDQDYQSQGIGAILLDKAKERAKELNLRYLWLGVWERNPKAIRFYERHGFKIFSSHFFTMGDEVQKDMLMRWNIP